MLKTLALFLSTFLISSSCRSRGEMPKENNPDQLQPDTNSKPSSPPQDIPSMRSQDSTAINNEPKKDNDTKPSEEKDEAVVAAKPDPVIAPPTQGTLPRVETFVFTHANLCLQLEANGSTSLQTCKEQSAGQKFIFNRSLDGQFQFKNNALQQCLAAGSRGLLTTLLRGESCALKANQFFSVIDYGNVYSLKADSINACIDAENSGVLVGTRLILYRCAAAANQKILTVKKS